MRERNRDSVAELEPRADAAGQAGDPEHALDRKPSDRDNQARPEKAKLPLEPEAAEVELTWARRPIPSPARMPARIAARDRAAVEGRVERVLVQLEPAAECLAGPPAPGPALPPFDAAGGLADA